MLSTYNKFFEKMQCFILNIKLLQIITTCAIMKNIDNIKSGKIENERRYIKNSNRFKL